MFAFTIFGLGVCAVFASAAMLKAMDVVMRYFGHDTIGRFCDRLGVGYARRLRVPTATGYTTIIVRGSR